MKTFHILSFSVNGGPKYGQTSPHTPKYLISMQKSEEMSKKKLRNCPSSDARCAWTPQNLRKTPRGGEAT